MFNKIKKTTAICIAFTFLLYLITPLYAYAATGSTSTLLSKWKSLGLISDQSEVYTKPSEAIKRLEFFTLVNKIFKYEEKSDISFPDVVRGSWYSGELEKAVAAGYLKNDAKLNATPFQPLNRLDAAVIIANVFYLTVSGQGALSGVSDADKIPSGSRDAVCAVLEKGIINKSADGRFVPLGTISRSDAISMLDKIMGTLVNKSGVHSTKTNGNMVVNTTNVTLSNIAISGDLYLAEGIGSGSVLVQNVTITGRTIVRGGGANTIVFKNSTLNGGLYVMKKDGKVRIVTQDNTSIPVTNVKSGALLEEGQGNGKGFQDVVIDGTEVKGQKVRLTGSYNSVKSLAEGAGIQIDGTVGSLEIGEEASGSSVGMTSGTLDQLSIRGARSSANLTGGTVKNLTVYDTADTPKIVIDGSSINSVVLQTQTTLNLSKGSVQTLSVGSGANGSVIQTTSGTSINTLVANSGVAVKGGGTITYASINSQGVTIEQKPGTTNIKQGITAVVGGGTSTSNAGEITLSVGAPEVVEGETTQTYTYVSPSTASLTFSSLNPAIASVDSKGLITGVSEGTTTIFVTATLSGFNTNSKSFTVNVLSKYKTKAGTLTVSPSVQAANSKNVDITLTYTAGTNLNGGTVVFTLPFGFSATAVTDMVSIAGANPPTPLAASQITGQKVILSDLTLNAGQTVVLLLNDKTIPSVGQYTFSAKADADGDGKDKVPSSGTGSESAVFTANSIKQLVAGTHYGALVYGSVAGTTKITDLSFREVTGAEKWIVKVQDDTYAVPNLDSTLDTSIPGNVIDDYKAGMDIPANVNQHLVLLATDKDGKIKAYADIVLTVDMIKPYDAVKLTAGSYSTPEMGEAGGTTKIQMLPIVAGADKWMVKVQDANLENAPYAGTKMEGAVDYTAGQDITIKENQYLILLATTNDGGIIAYDSIKVEGTMICVAAIEMKDSENWYSLPTIGTVAGNTMFESLVNLAAPTDPRFQINATKWQVKIQNDPFKVPAKDSVIDTTALNVIDNYSQKTNIPISAGQHLLLLAVDDAGHIKAYRDFTITAEMIRPANAVELTAGTDYTVSRGSKPGTTIVTGLNPSSMSGASVIRAKVQDNGLTDVPYMDSVITDSTMYYGGDINTKVGQHLIILATDRDGKIKAYADISLTDQMVKPPLAHDLTNANFSTPVKGTVKNGTTVIATLSNAGYTSISHWYVSVQNTAFAKPSLGDAVFGTVYTAGGEIDIAADQHLMLLGVDDSFHIVAYADMTVSASQIKLPPAAPLVLDTNYPAPVKGNQDGTTKLAWLSPIGVSGVNGWRIKVQDAALPTAPGYETNVEDEVPGTRVYSANSDISITADKYVILIAVDSKQQIKAYASIKVGAGQIKSITAGRLVEGSNYTKPVPDDTNVGATRIMLLDNVSFPTIDSWWYKVSDTAFDAPSIDDVASAGNGYTSYNETQEINIKAGQNLLLVGADTNNSNKIVAYATFVITSDQIKPKAADELQSTINYSTPAQGSQPGTTIIENLSGIGFVGITRWWIKVQDSALAGSDIPGSDMVLNTTSLGLSTYAAKGNITITKGQYIILYGTDSYSRVKAYASILVDQDSYIRPALAVVLRAGTNYSAPVPGTDDGTTMIENFDDLGFKPITEWRYKVQDTPFDVPDINQTSMGTQYYVVGTGYVGGKKDITASAGQYLLLLAIGDNKVKGYAVIQLSPGQVNAYPAGKLALGGNYSDPVPGNGPGTTKIAELKNVGFLNISKWWYRVVTLPAASSFPAPDVNSLITADNLAYGVATQYTSGADIPVDVGQHIVLYAADGGNRIIAYADIEMSDSAKIKPDAAAKLTVNVNYKLPEQGKNDGMTQITQLSFSGLASDTSTWKWKYRIQSSQFDVPLIGSKDSLALPFAKDTDVPGTGTAADGQHLLLLAVNGSDEIQAYADITLAAGMIKTIGAVNLKAGTTSSENYSTPEPGSAGGTTKITYLNSFGIAGATKWQVIVRNTSINGVAPALNSQIIGAATYTLGSDILASDGQYLLLLVTDDAGNIKGYDEIHLASTNIRSGAILLTSTQCPDPVPGSAVGTTMFTSLPSAADLTAMGATKCVYKVQAASFGMVLKDSEISNTLDYPTLNQNITASIGQHLIILAIDDNGKIKAYKEFELTSEHIKGVNATISGTATSEAGIVAGEKTIIIKLSDGTWATDTKSDQAKRNALFDGFKAATETTEWAKVVTAMKNEGIGCIDQTDASTITITLPEIASYNISANQIISLTISASLINGASTAIKATNSFTIAVIVGAVLTGTLVSSTTNEADIVNGQKTLIITLTNGQWVTDIAGTPDKREALFNGLTAIGGSAVEWGKVVTALKAAGENAIMRNSSYKVTIILPKVEGYNIGENQAIALTIPKSAVIGAVDDIATSSGMTIYAIVSADITGTVITDPASETDIVSGGKSIVITLTDGMWASDIDMDKTKREALFNGFSAVTENTEWAKVITALKTTLIVSDAIKRNSDTQITINLPSTSGYNITSDQTVTLTIPTSAIVGAAAPVIASTSFKITAVKSATISGTALTAKSSDIVTGNKTIVITLSSCQWAADVVSNSAKLNSLIAGFTAGGTEGLQWDKVKAAMTSSTVVMTSNSVITITLPAVPGYNITSEQAIMLTVPVSVLLNTPADPIIASPVIKIASNPPPAATVSSVGSTTANGTYKTGDTINITVTFNTAVDVNGSPLLQLETGTTDHNAVYNAVTSSPTVLVFDYVVQSGDTSADLDYKSTTSLVLNSGTIRNAGTSVNATLTLASPGAANSLGDAKAIVIDTTAPVNTTGYPKAGTLTENKANILIKTTENGKTYYVVLASGDTAPNSQQVKAGNDSTGTTTGVINSGSSDITANTEGTVTISGLVSKTAYDIYTVSEDAVGNLQAAPVKVTVTIPDQTVPTFIAPYPQAGIFTDTAADVEVMINEAGKAYMVMLPNDAAPPISAQVKAGKNAAGTAVASNMFKTLTALAANTMDKATFTGLAVSTDYDVYVVCEDSAGNLKDMPVKVDVNTKPLILTGVGMDVGARLLTNTNTYMQYSVDSRDLDQPAIAVNGTWHNCTAADTASIPFTAGQVWVREAAHTDNMQKVGDMLPPRDAPMLASLIDSDYDVANTIKALGDAIGANAYEFSIGSSGTWISGEKAIEGQFTGTATVWVRLKGDISTLPSISQGIYFTANLDLSGVSVDVSSGMIKNTAVIMQYSLDSTNGKSDGTWYTCTAGNTTVDFVIGKVYIRAASQPENFRLLATVNRAQVPDITGVSYNVGAGTIIGTPDNTQYRIGGGEWANVTTGGTTSGIEFVAGYIELRTTAGTTTLASLPVTIGTIAEADKAPIAGTKVQAITDPKVAVVYDDDANTLLDRGGALLGKTYEYKIDSGVWTLGDVVGNFKGTRTVLVRIKADAMKLPSQSVEILFTANTLTVIATGSGGNIGLGLNDKVAITFEENTNKPQITVANLDAWLKLNNGHSWGTALTNGDIVWNTAGNILTVTFSSITSTTIAVGDTITIDQAAGIKNSVGTSAASTAQGTLAGSFSTVAIAASNAGSNIGLGINDKVTITFEENTNKPSITAANIDTMLPLKDAQGNSHTWGTALSDADIVWSSTGKVLTITFSDITGSTITARDIVTISPTAGIKNSTGTSQVCTTSVTITGTFTSPPTIQSVVIGNQNGVRVAGDTVTITFNQNTNKPAITAANLNTWLKLSNSHSWGSGSSFATVVWTADYVLTTTYSSFTGTTIAAGDIITVNASANIKDNAATTSASTSVSGGATGEF